MKINLDYKNKSIAGNVGLGYAIAWYASKGHSVSIPLTDTQDYDIIVEINGSLQKIQVKTTRNKPKKSKYYSCNLRVFGGNQSWSGVSKYFDTSKIDRLFIAVENGDLYDIPSYVIIAKCSISLGEKYNQYKVDLLN